MRNKLLQPTSILLIVFIYSATGFAQPWQPRYGTITPTAQTFAHDPVLIKQDSVYYLFCTGWGITVYSSTDLKNWKHEHPVFEKAPQWAVDTIPNFKGHIWAPDISYFNGLYYLYYSVSAFGKNTSAIGVATAKTLHPADPNFGWTDHGRVIQSYPHITNWNAIDPNIIADKTGAYMVFGSFWDGIKLVKLTPDRLQIAEDPAKLHTIASRKLAPNDPNPPAIEGNPADAGGNAIEAPFVFKKGNYYYLFVSIDYCCKGVNSTYKMLVGRSKKISGPYYDKNGFDMAKKGGTLVLKGDSLWYGVGHNAVVSLDGSDYLIFHGYDALDEGKPKLRIEKLEWVDEWPEVPSPAVIP